MALKFGLGARKHITNFGGLLEAIQGGIIEFFTGTAPTSPDDAESGTKLCRATLAAAAFTAEVRSTGTVTITGGTSGTITGITVNGVQVLGATVTWVTSHAATAALIAAQINRYVSSPNYEASASGAVVTIKAMPGTGTGPNTYVVATTVTGDLTKTDAPFAGGVAGVNGLTYQCAAGVLNLSGSASGTVLATGAAGYFRIKGSVADGSLAVNASADADGNYIRIQGTCGLSGADYIMAGTTTMTAGSIHTVGSLPITMQESA